MANSALPDTPELAAADAVAENIKRSGNDVTLTGIDPSRESALDDAFKSVVPSTEPAEELGKENGGVKRPLPGSPEPAAAKPAPEPVPEPAKPAAKPAAEPKAPAKRTGLLDDVLEEPAPVEEDTPEKAYDSVKLRSDASEKTQESFANQRALAIKRENAVRAELQAAKVAKLELETRMQELEKKSGALPEDVAKELKEHREFRALHDVSSRPEFRDKFDSKIEANYQTIYDLLKQEGWDDTKVATVKGWSESQRIDFLEKKILPLLTDGQRRVVEAKIYDNVNISAEKAKALDAARTDAEKILAEQREAPAKQQAQRDTEFANVLRPKLQKLAFVYPKEIPTTATTAQKAEIEAHNKLALEYQEDVTRAIKDNSPETRADIILAVPLARFLKRENVSLKLRAEAAEAKLAAITKAGATGRLGRAAPSEAPVAARPVTGDGGDHLDQLFKSANAGPGV